MPRRSRGSCLAALALSACGLTLGAVRVAAQTSTVVTSQVNPGGARAPGSCVNIAIKADYGGTWQCGDLIWTHPLPGTTTMGGLRQPVWRYSLDQATVIFSVGANVTTTASGVNQLRTVATFLSGAQGSSPVDSATQTTIWSSAWSTGAPRRVNISGILPTLVTGAYAYTFTVEFLDSTTMTVIATKQDTGTIGVVNRSTSPYGPGLWLDGVEQLSFQTPGSTQRFWVGGDGSTRLYTEVGSGVWVVTPAVDRPDTLVAISGGYRRHLPNGAYVQFDNYGNQVAAQNAQGQITQFFPNGAGGLDSLRLPVPGSGTRPVYAFSYTTGGGGAVTTTVTPPPVNGTARTAKAVWTGSATYDFDFYDPDDMYPKGELRLFSNGALSVNLNESGYGTQIGYDVGDEVSNSWVTLTVGQPSITQRFCAAEYASLTNCQAGWTGVTNGAPVDTGSVRTLYVGPRDSVDTYGDTLSIHVNAFGAPTKIIDADSGITTIQYSDTFPLLAVKTVGPTGTTTETAYNGRGLPDSSWVVSPYGGANAVTRYTWDATFNLPTKTTDPAGGTDSLSYDGSGNLLWEQDGRGALSRVTYTYNSDNQVDAVQPPGNSYLQVATSTFDSLGNVTASTTPMGFETQCALDAIGRDTLVSTPTDSAQTSGLRAQHRIVYDLMSRVTKTIDSGATIKYFILDTVTAPPNVLETRTYYDGPGRPTAVARQDMTGTFYDSTNVVYDQSGRRISSSSGSAGRHGYTYDMAGNVVADSTPRGFVLTRGYDAANRLAWMVTPVDSVGQDSVPNNTGNGCWCGTILNPYFGPVVIPRDSAIFRYDAAGRLDTAANYAAVITRMYYPGGALKADSTAVLPYMSGGTTTRYGITSSYDLAGRRDTLTLPSALLTICGGTCRELMGYNIQAGTLDTVTTFTGETFLWQVDAAGRDSVEVMPDGGTQQWTYDPDGRVRTRNEAGVYVYPVSHSDTLRYDAAGHVTVRATHSSPVLGSQNFIVTSHYSGLGAAIATQTNRSAMYVPNLLEEWQVDATGAAESYNRNRGNAIGASPSDAQPVIEGFGQGAYGRLNASKTYDSVSSGWWIYTIDTLDFDASGNATHAQTFSLQYDTAGAYDLDTASTVFRWYGANEKLRAVMTFGIDTIPGGWSTYNEYRYDALGRKVFARSRNLPRSDTLHGGAVSAAQRFVWDGEQLLGEVRVPGDSLAAVYDSLDTDAGALGAGVYFGMVAYTHAGGIDAPVAMNLRDSATLVLHTDGAGNFDATTTLAGAFCCGTIPFPAATALAYHAQPVTADLPGWAGSLVVGWQDEAGLMYMRNRWYDPAAQQFTQPDPAGLAGGANPYGYADGDPINKNDPFGTCPPRDDNAANCEPGTPGWYANRLATGQGSVALNWVGGLLSTCNDSYLCQGVLTVASLGGNLGIRAGANAAEFGADRVIGAYDEYITAAENLGAKYFDLPDALYRGLVAVFGQSFVDLLNERFLDEGIAEAADFVLASPYDEETAGVGLRKEVKYLLNHHYHWGPGKWVLIHDK